MTHNEPIDCVVLDADEPGFEALERLLQGDDRASVIVARVPGKQAVQLYRERP